MRSFLRSFVYAGRGIYVALREERNLRFHLCIAIYVYLFSAFYDFGKTEYAVITLLVAGVMALELVNSAFERTVSRPSPERYVTAGVVKDMAAGAVLVFSLAAVVIGILLFWDMVAFQRIFNFFTVNPIWLAPFVLSLAASGWFIFYPGKR